MSIAKTIFKVIKYILIGILLVVFISNFYVMIKSASNPGTHPDVFGYSTAVVVSGSMQPEINVDDLVVIKKQKEYSKGDIIAFRGGKSFVTHRIIEETPQGFVTQGDANNTADEALVRKQDISGEVIYTVKGVGRLVSFLKSPLGMMILFVFAFIIIIIPDKQDKEDTNTMENTQD